MADLSDDDYEEIASKVVERLDPGRYGSRFVLSRRQLLSIAGGSAGVAGLVALGVDPAAAQSAAGQVGTSSSPVDVFGATVDSGSYQLDGSAFAQSVAASGSVTLSSGAATVDTGITATDATFTLALGVDDPGADVDLSGRLFFDTSAGSYKVEIVEATTSVGNPTANYDVVRVR